MSRPFSAYGVLELEPGADRAAIEAAYRRLIKLHHPDRSGGDGQRAADINRAYFELRSLPVAPPSPARSPLRSRPRPRPRRIRKPRWLLASLALAPLALVQGDWMKDGRTWGGDATRAAAPVAAKSPIPQHSALEGPINPATVANAVDEATRLVEQGDETALVERSRECHRRLRGRPEVALLDRCAAFDNAVVALEDRDPNQDNGPFNASSVTARQMNAGSLLSNDYLAIERRLNRIRSQVEMALSPPVPVGPAVLAEGPPISGTDLEP